MINPFIGSVVAGASTPEWIAKREAEAARQAALSDQVTTDQNQTAAARAYAEANPFVPTIPEYFTDLESTSYVNPYYVGPQTGGYSRFDTSQVGSGLTNLANPAAAFDAIVASQFFNPVDLGGADSQTALAAYNLLGSGVVGERSPELQAGFDFNKTLGLNKERYKNYFDAIPQARDFFRSQGIDLDSIKSLEDLDAIDSTLKGDVFGRFVDEQERAKQFENQKAKSGIGDALGGFGGLIGPVFGGLVGGPLGGAIFGGLTGGFDSGPLGALTGALSGYGIGNTLTNGITNPFTGTNYTGPIAHGGSGVPFPTGDFTHGGRDILDVGGIGNPFPDLPPLPPGPDPTPDPRNPFNFPPIFIPPGGSPGSDDPQENTPPLAIPPIITTPPPGSGGSPSIPTPTVGGTTYALGGGGQQSFPPFMPGAIPGPPDPLKYFQFGQNPFL